MNKDKKLRVMWGLALLAVMSGCEQTSDDATSKPAEKIQAKPGIIPEWLARLDSMPTNLPAKSKGSNHTDIIWNIF